MYRGNVPDVNAALFPATSRRCLREGLPVSRRTALEDSALRSVFGGPEGARESHLVLSTGRYNTFTRALDEASHAYHDALIEYGLSDETLVFTRVYLSDIRTQMEPLRSSALLRRLRTGAVSIVEQAPALRGPVSLLSYHIETAPASAAGKVVLNHSIDGWRNGVVFTGRHYSMLWTANHSGLGQRDTAVQTREIFRAYASVLRRHSMSLLKSGVRSWIYVRDIDDHYREMVRARRAFFEAEGLTPRTRYLASTGIEGNGRDADSLVTMDTLSYGNLCDGQIVRMEAPENLSPTIAYGVTFERGLRLRFGDRSHLYVSGTASIDRNGDVMYPNDVRRQTERILDNMRVLLAPHGAGLSDMAYLIVYLRDTRFAEKVLDIVSAQVPQGVPLLTVRGAVCRPSWLVEMEGMGIIHDRTQFKPFI